jgi:CheY-like chemotaxis protein
VDDAEDSRAMYGEYLRHAGWEVEETANGLEALHVVESFAPDVIVMDLAMPELDGVSAIRRLKHDPRLRAIPIAALTAHPMRTADAFAAGCDAVYLKPFAPSALAEALTKTLDGKDG